MYLNFCSDLRRVFMVGQAHRWVNVPTRKYVHTNHREIALEPREPPNLFPRPRRAHLYIDKHLSERCNTSFTPSGGGSPACWDYPGLCCKARDGGKLCTLCPLFWTSSSLLSSRLHRGDLCFFPLLVSLDNTWCPFVYPAWGSQCLPPLCEIPEIATYLWGLTLQPPALTSQLGQTCTGQHSNQSGAEPPRKNPGESLCSPEAPAQPLPTSSHAWFELSKAGARFLFLRLAILRDRSEGRSSAAVWLI